MSLKAPYDTGDVYFYLGKLNDVHVQIHMEFGGLNNPIGNIRRPEANRADGDEFAQILLDLAPVEFVQALMDGLVEGLI